MTVFYLYDALCGWCYGFAPVMKEFYARHHATAEFVVVSGGMVRGERIGPIGEVAPYIAKAYTRVEETCGVTFGQDFLEGILQTGTALFTSEPPAIALSIIKEREPEQSVAFAERIQYAVYYEGIEPADTTAYGVLAKDFGWEPAEFTALMHEALYQARAEEDFLLCHRFGVTGFPTVIVEEHGVYALVSQGYVPLSVLEERFVAAQDYVRNHHA
jgi:putative protein-disulfide isomerase